MKFLLEREIESLKTRLKCRSDVPVYQSRWIATQPLSALGVIREAKRRRERRESFANVATRERTARAIT